ncbi:MAG: family 16 glycosylhydrolase [Acidobacteriaceae bacterium]
MTTLPTILSGDHPHRSQPLPRLSRSAGVFSVARSHVLVLFCVAAAMGCSGSSANTGGGGGGTPQTATPAIATTAAQGGAQIVTLSDTTSDATIYFTLDGSTPTVSSAQYFAPLLVASNETLRAVAIAAGDTISQVATQAFSPNIASGTLVWSDEFSNSTSSNAQPNPSTWTYDSGAGGWGNQELETYCSWGSSTSPCSTANPNTYVGTDGYLHIVAQQPSAGVYTSARLKTEGLFSFMYGRIEARMQIPESQGLWPAFWLLGSNIATVDWPACGEQDIMEHINAPVPDWVAGSLHGTNLNLTQDYPGTTGQTFSASDWHVYGMIWTKGEIQYYIDSPSNIYATYTPSSQSGGTWPFDSGSGAFIILNLAVGGNWPGSPNGTTPFPSQLLVDYVRIYTN